MYQPKLTVKTAAELKAILGKDFPSQVAKIIDPLIRMPDLDRAMSLCGHFEHQRGRGNGCFAEG
jgi:hypothetical protein